MTQRRARPASSLGLVGSLLLSGGMTAGNLHAQTVPSIGLPAAADVVVTAPRGQTVGGIAPLLDISPSELDSYGVDTLSDLVDALRPLTRSSRSDQMAVILINGHLAGPTEFDNLPREAVERVEVLPETVALQYGFSENQRVLNFILRENYAAAPTRLAEAGATEGGAQQLAADASFVNLNHEARITVLGTYQENAWLRDSDRRIDLSDAVDRTLLPHKTDAKFAATASRSVFGVSASLEGSFEDASSRSLQGLAPPPAGSTAAQVPAPLQQLAPQQTSRVAAQLTGQLGRFIWGATAYYLHVDSNSSTDVGAGGRDPLIERTASAFNAGNLQLSFSGPWVALPAGPLVANAKFGLQYQGFETRDAYPGDPPTASNLVRSIRSGSINASVPLSNPDRHVMAALGELSATFNLALDNVSQFGTLLSMSYGLDWRPVERVHIDAIYTDHRAAPTAQQLLAPAIYTPNVELFDFVANATAYVTEISGGNAALNAADSRVASIGGSLGPFFGKTTFAARFEQNQTRNAIGALPPLTADVELAFPQRFVRDAGVLTEVDDRWVNLARQTSDDLKWGCNIWVPFAADADRHAMQNRFELSLFDTWYLRDVTLIRGGVPAQNLLDGSPSDLTGGQPRHKIEFHALIFDQGVGALLAADYRTATVVDSGGGAAPDPIYFSALATADLRLFTDFEHLPPTRGRRWAKGARLSFAVTNVLDKRQSVRDAGGATPAAFEPGFLDPAGRQLMLTARKVF